MASWTKYKKTKTRDSSPRIRELWAVKKSVHRLHHEDNFKRKIYSSISLPNFTKYRLQGKLTKQGTRQNAVKMSQSEIVIACLIMLATKMRLKKTLLRPLSAPRCRLYNDATYSYEKISIYTDRSIWHSLQARALELDVSLSFLADLAIRLYLNTILEKLMNVKKQGMLSHQRISPCHYQRRILWFKYRSHDTPAAHFSLQIRYQFNLNTFA
ncbi:MAG: hypothetical protein NZM25_06625 [Leptospiraceae bacterium]|nr:hypothetical protein [Leptospiraceae bacterium]MDW8306550.1 hypothetical protein [Leptospiraceae bacterium]